MNFLAHVYLSGDDKEIAFGNFIGDFVKGDYKSVYSEKIALGITLHRKIDHFTDHHDLFKKSKARLRNISDHYPPVIMDIFYDHILARNWEKYHSTPLKEFTAGFYANCEPLKHMIPSKSLALYRYMVKQDWLFNYSKIEGIEKTLIGLSKRSSFKSNMEKASLDLVENYSDLEKDFNDFFPEVIHHSKSFIAESNQ